MIESPVWDIRDNAPVFTRDQIIRIVQGRVEPEIIDILHAEFIARLERYEATVFVIDAFIDGAIVNAEAVMKVIIESALKEEKHVREHNERRASRTGNHKTAGEC